MLHKLRCGLVRLTRDTIGALYPVEVDETLVGGRTRGERRGVHHKAAVVDVVDTPEDRNQRPEWQTQN